MDPEIADTESLRSRLSKSKFRDRDLLREAASTPAGTALLAEQLKSRQSPYDRVTFAAFLGDGVGDAGIEDLRESSRTTGPGTTDLRCASLLALAKRLHSAATPDLHVALEDKNRTVREYAMLGLAAFGTDEAWETAFTVLAGWLKRPTKRKSNTPDEVEAVCYLIRTGTLDGIRRVQALLGSFAGRLEPHISAALSEAWPGWENEDVISDADVDLLRGSTRAWFERHSSKLFRPVW